ncbi:putative oxidoreductase (short-chain dehydrogenase family) [Natrialba magadii ATCC 43099]|uniref:Oxidoreductase (Short-chain dehydrogenase family) n=1 Tax=Natrialba magadii (strain ATCC 43099 / DSM 3394 / CCM 3739 / CIP 104546 / IAM 13178 / JCM 8861 / NBRC 102185 / NCIMB 2190 / MS3) TaxID=547559 RepID=D3T0I9_NATMM|nr:oxidoreductase [Natrialba magadii]ADD06468.1 putative oxidoreductase (short-chain dehydrogenase family) [Natrialba magadii ATCC 43099]ELY31644.1 short-chain dehydrogenase/reductase SDR [Natrialba magadii ATCC 43099]
MGWTTDDIPDQQGRTTVVTGANSGIGRETTCELARNGATVIMACRSLDRGEKAAVDICREVPDADLRVKQCDLASLESVREFAARVDDPIDVVINNAGTMAIPRSETADGFETQFGVNHLGHFALTGLLLDRLQTAADESGDDARIVTVSSGMHERGDIDFDDLHHESSYDPWDAYAQSKLANVLFAYELERRLLTADANAKSIAVHPGYAATKLQFRGPEETGARGRKAVRWLLNTLLAQSSKRGALPTLYAATVPDAKGGAYYGPGGLANMRGTPERQASAGRSYDEETARRLWKVSRELTGVTYDLPQPDSESSTPAGSSPQS